jgi:hypothetical protein
MSARASAGVFQLAGAPKGATPRVGVGRCSLFTTVEKQGTHGAAINCRDFGFDQRDRKEMSIVAEAPLRVEDTRAYAQGEIFLLTRAGESIDALVYNTTGFGPCPATEFAAIDVEQVAVDTESDLAWKNPRRSWMMDALQVNIVGEPREFGGVKFNLSR